MTGNTIHAVWGWISFKQPCPLSEISIFGSLVIKIVPSSESRRSLEILLRTEGKARALLTPIGAPQYFDGKPKATQP
jgi:hypothetical protein